MSKLRFQQKRVDWLETATADLSDSAKRRINLEINAHFADSVENHQANGYSEADAFSAALDELGDASAAAKRFRRQHLTEKEAKHIRSLLKYGSKPAGYILFCVFIICCFVFLAERSNFRQASLGLTILAVSLCIAVGTVVFVETRRERSKLDVQLIVLASVLGDCLVLFFMWRFIDSEVAWGLLIGQIPRLFKGLHLWLKVIRAEKNEFDLPSQGATAS